MNKSALTLELLKKRTNHRQAVICMCRNDCDNAFSSIMGDYFVVIDHHNRYGFKTADGQFFKYAIPVQVVELTELSVNKTDNNGWIKIEQGGFEEGQEILITDGKEVWTDTVMFDCEDGVHFIYFDDGSDPENVTHWQAKPEPPKEKSNEISTTQ